MSFFTHRRKPASMKQLYVWFNKYYGCLENILSPAIGEAVSINLSTEPELGEKTALEYACGTGFLTEHIAPLYKNVLAKDQSAGMMDVARKRMKMKGLDSKVEFQEGNLLEITEPDKSFDYAFISFALHLFSPEDQERILSRLLRVARKKVIIIDHVKKWDFITALIEWYEGSYYEMFIKMDFNIIAAKLNTRNFMQDDRKDCVVLIFENWI